MLNIQRILVPIDFSREARVALSGAVMIARREPGSRITLLHVLPYATDPAYSVGWSDEFLQVQRDRAMESLNTWKERIPWGIDAAILVTQGDVPKAIARVCADNDEQLVVMATNGRRGLYRVFNPNTSEETVRVAPCPVLVLRMNRPVRRAGRRSLQPVRAAV